jgi:hypothetical protein
MVFFKGNPALILHKEWEGLQLSDTARVIMVEKRSPLASIFADAQTLL